MLINNNVIYPQWPAPPHVYAAMSTRAIPEGVSLAPFEHFNLGDHVQDNPSHVVHNRKIWTEKVKSLHPQNTGTDTKDIDLHLVYLKQVHGTDVVLIDSQTAQASVADACISVDPYQACTIMVADCLPVIFCTEDGQVLAAAHAGWRGLLDGVLEATVQAMTNQVNQLQLPIHQKIYAWLGPCIGPTAFEVGQEVFDAFCGSSELNDHYKSFFQKQENGKWMADLPAIARQKLKQFKNILCFGNDSSLTWCTFQSPNLFFSHRRDAAILGSTGRMAVSIFRG
jgi:YfiH family protein